MSLKTPNTKLADVLFLLLSAVCQLAEQFCLPEAEEERACEREGVERDFECEHLVLTYQAVPLVTMMPS